MKRLPEVALLVALLLSLYGIVYATLLRESDFIAKTLVDDALYYLIPAQHLLAGQGFSFDGLHRTNGVEPLWALVTIGIAALTPDRLNAMRLMVFVSGLLWVAGAVTLFAGLRRLNSYAASIAAAGFLFTGFTNRMAIIGMENGLGAFCFAMVIAAGVQVWEHGEPGLDRPGRPLIGLSVAAALVALTRIEYVLLPMLLCVLVLLPGECVRDWRRWRWRPAFVFGLPTLLLFGGYLVLNLAYFGMLTPVSGEVKLYYQQLWGSPYGNWSENIRWQFSWLLSNGLGAFTLPTEDWFWRRWAVVAPHERLLIGATACLAVGLGMTVYDWIRQGLSPWTPLGRFWAVIAAFAALHWVMMAVLMAPFTLYGIWYFPIEMMVFWVGVGLAVSTFAGLLEKKQMTYAPPALVTLMVLWLIVINYNDWFRVAGINFSNVNTFAIAARWINQNLPAGQRIGSLSSGYLGYYAPNQRIFNLDGFINNADYLQNYLKKGRVDEYIRGEQMGYFADYAETSRWMQGISWRGKIPLNELELVNWWPMSGDLNDKGLSYALWRILPAGAQHKVLDACTGFCVRLSQIQFAAAALHEYPMIDENKLPQYLNSHPDSRVVTSVYLPGQPFYHVLMSHQQLEGVPLQIDQLDVGNRLDVTFGNLLRLRGFDAREWRIARSEPFVFSRYWQVSKALPVKLTVEVYTTVYGRRLTLHSSELAHGTYSASEWQAGEVVAETYLARLPANFPSGSYPIYVGVHDNDQGWLPSSVEDPDHKDFAFVGNLEVVVQ